MDKKASKYYGYDSPLAKRLRKLLEKNGITQEELAIKLECSRQTIAQYKDGAIIPALDNIYKIAKIFNVSSDYLLGLSGSSTTDKDKQFVSNYTGLSDTSIDKLHQNRNKIDNTTFFDYLINDTELTNAIKKYLFSSLYNDFIKSDKEALPLDSNVAYIREPEFAHKIDFSNLIETLPIKYAEITKKLFSENEELKEDLLMEYALTHTRLDDLKIMYKQIKQIDEYDPVAQYNEFMSLPEEEQFPNMTEEEAEEFTKKYIEPKIKDEEAIVKYYEILTKPNNNSIDDNNIENDSNNNNGSIE